MPDTDAPTVTVDKPESQSWSQKVQDKANRVLRKGLVRPDGTGWRVYSERTGEDYFVTQMGPILLCSCPNGHSIPIPACYHTAAVSLYMASDPVSINAERWGLSPRETVILRYLLDGRLKIADIAQKEDRSKNTIYSQSRSIYRKARVFSRVDLLNLIRTGEHKM